MDRCIVKNCNFSPVLNELFASPNQNDNSRKLKKWQQAVGTNFTEFFVCDQHFDKKDLIVEKNLEENAIPRLRLNNETIKLENDCCAFCLEKLEDKYEIQQTFINTFKEICGYKPLTDFMCQECKSSLIRYKKFQTDIKLKHALIRKAVMSKVQVEEDLTDDEEFLYTSQSIQDKPEKVLPEPVSTPCQPLIEQNINACIHCSEIISDRLAMWDHLNFHHSFSCDACSFTSGNAQTLTNHVEKNHRGSKFKCNLCKGASLNFISKAILDIHKENVHLSKEFYCLYCELKYQKAWKLRLHVAECHPFNGRKLFLRSFSSKIKENEAKKDSLLSDNVEMKEEPDEYDDINYSEKEHQEEEEQKIKLIEDVEETSSDLNLETAVKCLDCGLKFSVGSLLAHRTLMHPGIRDEPENSNFEDITKHSKLIANDSKPAPEKSARKQQIKSKDEQLMIVCEHCFVEVREDKLDKHIDDLHSGKTFLCQVCSKEFHSEKIFKRHEISHYPDQMLTCDYCGTKKAHKKRMRIHMKYHSSTINTKKQCKICLKVCDKLNGIKPLRVHMERYHQNGYDCGARANSETNYFDCFKCGASYANLGIFRKHDCEKGRYQLRCPECQKPFGNAEIMKAHQKNGCRTKQGNFWKGGRFRK